jgi:exopolysaccharide production protein ExoZ
LVAVLLTAEALRSRIDVMNFYANPIMLEFLAGALLGVAYLWGKIGASRLWFGAMVVGFLLLWRGQDVVPAGLPFVGPAATLIVAAALFSPPITIRFLQRLGDGSYSLYLTHVITLAAIATLWKHQSIFHQEILFCLVSLSAAVLLAMACYILVEVPLTSGLRQHLFSTSSRSKLRHAAAPSSER